MGNWSVCSKENACWGKDKKDLDFIQFKKLKLIGVGAFGRVWTVMIEKYTSKKQVYEQTPENQIVYALKEMNKAIIVAKGALRIANNEVKILKSLPKSEFIVNMWHSFQDETNAYLLMDYAPCGDLLFHMKRLKSKQIICNDKGGTFSEMQSKFILAWVLEALRVMHESEIVHRDIKPDNIIIDSNGYIKLADFGVAEYLDKIIPGSQFGTLCYMAPEIIFEHEYSYTVDYYSLGVLLLLLTTGDMLSVGKSTREAKKAISLRRDTLTTKRFIKRYPLLSEDWCDLIVRLLTTSQHQRIGSKGGVDEILQHSWFDDIDLKAVQQQSMISPIYDIATDHDSIMKLTSFEDGKGEETDFWMRKEKKAMRMLSKAYVDYGNYWTSNFHQFKFMDVQQLDNKGNQMESSMAMRKHTMTSIMRKREESLSHLMHRDGISVEGPSDFTRISTGKTGIIDRKSELELPFSTPSTKSKRANSPDRDYEMFD